MFLRTCSKFICGFVSWAVVPCLCDFGSCMPAGTPHISNAFAIRDVLEINHCSIGWELGRDKPHNFEKPDPFPLRKSNSAKAFKDYKNSTKVLRGTTHSGSEPTSRDSSWPTHHFVLYSENLILGSSLSSIQRTLQISNLCGFSRNFLLHVIGLSGPLPESLNDLL